MAVAAAGPPAGMAAFPINVSNTTSATYTSASSVSPTTNVAMA